MEEKTRAQSDKDRERALSEDPAEYGCKVLTPVEIAALYPGVPIDKTPWTPEHRDFMQRRNINARKSYESKKKVLPSFEE